MNIFQFSFIMNIFQFSFLSQSVNRNSIVIISKGYNYVIILGIISNFYISIDPVYPRSLANDLSWQVKSGESRFSLLHRSSSPLYTIILERAQLEQHRESVSILFSPSLSILSIVQFKSQSIILFLFPSFLFCI